MLTKFKKRVAMLIAAITIALTGVAVPLIVNATPASAGGSYLYRTCNGCSIWITPSFQGSTGTLARSGTPFTMICYRDGNWMNFFGNYWTNRYFYGTAYTSIGAYNVWVTASDVGAQVAVRSC